MVRRRKTDVGYLPFNNKEWSNSLAWVEESEEEQYWVGKCELDGQSILTYLYGGCSQIHEYQKEILLELVNRYESMKPTVEMFINKSIAEFEIKESSYSIDKDFTICYISIFESESKELEITYDLNNDFSLFQVHFENFMPNGLGISA